MSTKSVKSANKFPGYTFFNKGMKTEHFMLNADKLSYFDILETTCQDSKLKSETHLRDVIILGNVI